MDDLGIGVQVSSHAPGVMPVAFVAFVEVIDAEGMRHVVQVESDGLTAERAARLLADAPT